MPLAGSFYRYLKRHKKKLINRDENCRKKIQDKRNRVLLEPLEPRLLLSSASVFAAECDPGTHFEKADSAKLLLMNPSTEDANTDSIGAGRYNYVLSKKFRNPFGSTNSFGDIHIYDIDHIRLTAGNISDSQEKAAAEGSVAAKDIGNLIMGSVDDAWAPTEAVSRDGAIILDPGHNTDSNHSGNKLLSESIGDSAEIYFVQDNRSHEGLQDFDKSIRSAGNKSGISLSPLGQGPMFSIKSADPSGFGQKKDFCFRDWNGGNDPNPLKSRTSREKQETGAKENSRMDFAVDDRDASLSGKHDAVPRAAASWIGDFVGDFALIARWNPNRDIRITLNK